ncbi:hypothetical protein CBL_01400 [Carabus blaptoides fortunei]
MQSPGHRGNSGDSHIKSTNRSSNSSTRSSVYLSTFTDAKVGMSNKRPMGDGGFSSTAKHLPEPFSYSVHPAILLTEPTDHFNEYSGAQVLCSEHRSERDKRVGLWKENERNLYRKHMCQGATHAEGSEARANKTQSESLMTSTCPTVPRNENH